MIKHVCTTYSTAKVYLEEGGYSRKQLEEFIEFIDRMNEDVSNTMSPTTKKTKENKRK